MDSGEPEPAIGCAGKISLLVNMGRKKAKGGGVDHPVGLPKPDAVGITPGWRPGGWGHGYQGGHGGWRPVPAYSGFHSEMKHNSIDDDAAHRWDVPEPIPAPAHPWRTNRGKSQWRPHMDSIPMPYQARPMPSWGPGQTMGSWMKQISPGR